MFQAALEYRQVYIEWLCLAKELSTNTSSSSSVPQTNSQPHTSQPHPSQSHPSQSHPSQTHPSQSHPSQTHPSQSHPSQPNPSKQFKTSKPHPSLHTTSDKDLIMGNERAHLPAYHTNLDHCQQSVNQVDGGGGRDSFMSDKNEVPGARSELSGMCFFFISPITNYAISG